MFKTENYYISNHRILANKYLIFSIVVVINVFLKSFFGGNASFNYDEIISIKNTLLDFGHIKHEAEWDNNPPFYYYSLWVWHKIVPTNEFNSRFISTLFVSFSIGLSYLFAVKYFNQKTALFSAILLTLSNFLLYYSLEARVYSLVLMLALLSTLQFFAFVSRPTIVNLLILSLLNFLIVYSHYISGLVLLAQYLVIFYYDKKTISLFFCVNTLIVAGLIFLRFTKKQFLHILGYNQTGTFWLKKATLKDLFIAIQELFYNQVSAFVFFICLLSFIYYYFRDKDQNNKSVRTYCLLLSVCAIFFLFAVGTFKALFLDRYLIFCVPFATILVSFQLSLYRIYGTIIFLALLLIQLVNYNVVKESNMDYKAIAKLVKTNITKGDYILINTKDNMELFEFYYDKNAFLRFKNKDSVYNSQNLYGVNYPEELAKINLGKGHRIFLVQSFHKLNGPASSIQRNLSGSSKKIYNTTFYNGVELTVYSN